MAAFPRIYSTAGKPWLGMQTESFIQSWMRKALSLHLLDTYCVPCIGTDHPEIR